MAFCRFADWILLSRSSLIALALFVATGASAQTAPGASANLPDGVEQCLSCHSEPPASNILDSRHGNTNNPATPFAQDGCQNCHGMSADHASSMQSPAVVFKVDSALYQASPAGVQNQMCLSCHLAEDEALRQGGIHPNNGTACAACHTIHRASP